MVELALPCAASLAPEPEPLTRAALSTVRKILLSQEAKGFVEPPRRITLDDVLASPARAANSAARSWRPASAAASFPLHTAVGDDNTGQLAIRKTTN